ncbi:MAG: zinc ribbon domain-containing protein [Polyangiaceae bacterium]|nr:zinc ribbon domain-containing protein [Polyangiaceae bacterium]
MPTFEFLCEDCGREFEELVFRRDEVIECPACGSDRATKLMSAFAVTGDSRLSGGGCGSCKASASKCGGCGGK